MEDNESVTIVIMLSEALLVRLQVEVNTRSVTAIGNDQL